MKTDEFSARDWIDSLAAALPKLAQVQKPYLDPHPSFPLLALDPLAEGEHAERGFPLDDLRMLYQRARHCEGTVEGRNFEPLLAELNPVRHIVNAHPTVAAVASPLIGRDEFSMQILGSGGHTCTTDLIAGLMARADEHARDRYRAAARELNAFLAPGDDEASARVLGGLDAGCDAVLFYGPTLSERVEVAEGMALLPFDQVRNFVDESFVHQLAPPFSGLHGWQSVGAAVRSFRWKPKFSPAHDRGLGDPAPRVLGSFSREPRLFLELLAVSHGAPVLCLAELVGCIDRSGAQLLGREYRGPGFYRGSPAHRFDGAEPMPEADPEAIAEARKAYEDRESERFGKYEPVVARLSEALARDGRFAFDDRILDVAIALERMYELDGSELSHKMRARVAWFLGTDAESRVRELTAAKEFYSARSAIVHGGKKRANVEKRREAFDKGFDLARRSLFRLLREGPPEDWDALVVGGISSEGA